MMSRDDQNVRLQDLRKVLEITRSLAASTQLGELLNLIIARSTELLQAERASLFLYERGTNELVSRIATGVRELRVPADRGISGATVQTGKTIVVPDAYADERFNPDVDKRTGYRTRNILSVPLRDYEGGLVGVLQIINKHHGRDFDDYDVMLAETLAAQAGVAIQRARLIEHYIRKQQMERAMMIARDIQRGLLPDRNPDIAGFDVAGFAQPADETGGDTYDFMRLPDGRWLIIIADATGHGIGAALVIAETRAMLRALSLQGSDTRTVLRNVNDLLAADLGGGRFVTCFLGVLDPSAGTLTYASAGHGPMLFFTHQTHNVRQAAATSLPLGVLPGTDYETIEQVTMAPGDMAVIITDGFFEATDPSGEQFGIKRVIDLVHRDHELGAPQIIANLHAAVERFTRGCRQADDLTAIVIRKT